jgi:transposase-like protein
MAETRRKFDQDFRDGAVRIVEESDMSIAQMARELGINAGTLANGVNMARKRAASIRAHLLLFHSDAADRTRATSMPDTTPVDTTADPLWRTSQPS